jgi:hypothetical protein
MTNHVLYRFQLSNLPLAINLPVQNPHLVSVQYLADAPVGHPQLSGDDAGSDPVGGHLNNLQSYVVGQGSPVYEDATQLVDPTLTWQQSRG